MQDPYLHRNASTAHDAVPVESVQTLPQDNISIIVPEIVEEQLDYEEEECNDMGKKPETIIVLKQQNVSNAETETHDEKSKGEQVNKKRNNNNVLF